jgi:hypothetical protein
MSSSKVRSMLFVAFIVLTLLFGSLYVFELVKSPTSAIETSTTTSTTTVTSETTVYTNPTFTITSTSTTCPVPSLQGNRGFIEISTSNTSRTIYAYAKWNESFPSTFTFYNVTFNRWTITTITNTFGSCYGGVGGYGGYVIVFQDGPSENMSACTVGPNPPVDIRLTKHTNPQAGFLIIPQSDAFYFLVST